MAKKSLKGRELETADENWLVSYADMMTGLVLLFVLLYVMTAVKAKGMVQKSKAEVAKAEAEVVEVKKAETKAETAAKAAKTTTATIPTTTAKSASKTGKTSGTTGKTSTSSQSVKNPTKADLQQYVSGHSALSGVGVSSDTQGVKFVIQASVLFDAGSSQIRSSSYPMLKKLAVYLKTLDNSVVISGHTDNQPVQSKAYQSNWELSCDRSVKVLRYLTDSCAVNPKRFVALGYGEYKPVASNSTAAGREKNNRVEILVVEK